MRTGGQADMTKLKSLSQFCKRNWIHVQHTRPPVIFALTPTSLITLHTVSYDGRQHSPRRYFNLALCRLMLDSYSSCLKKYAKYSAWDCRHLTHRITLFYEHTGPVWSWKALLSEYCLSDRLPLQGHPISFIVWSSMTQSPAYYFVIKDTCKQCTELLRPLNWVLGCTLSTPQERR